MINSNSKNVQKRSIILLAFIGIFLISVFTSGAIYAATPADPITITAGIDFSGNMESYQSATIYISPASLEGISQIKWTYTMSTSSRWTLSYLPNTKVSFSASPGARAIFSFWEVNSETLYGSSTSISVVVQGGETIVGKFWGHFPTPSSQPTPWRVTPTPRRGQPTATPTPTPTPTSRFIATRIESSVTSLFLYAPVTSKSISVTLKDANSGAGIPGKTINWSATAFISFDNTSTALSVTDSQGVATVQYWVAEAGSGIVTGNLKAAFAGDSVYAGSNWQIPVSVQMQPTPVRRVTPTQRVTPTPTPTPTPTSRGGNNVVSYVIQSDWGNGATVNVTIKNNSAAAINGWTLAWTFPGNQKITDLWNGTYTQSGTAVSVKNAGSNAIIPAGGSVNFGFNLSYSGVNAKPASFTLNGTVCQVQ